MKRAQENPTEPMAMRPPEGRFLCQSCGTANGEREEFCRRCHQKLLVVSGPALEEDLAFDAHPDDSFSFDEHLLERISVLEEVVKRSAETLRQLLAALRKQERNILINNTGLGALRELLEQREVLPTGEWNELWQSRVEDQLQTMERRERFLARRERIASLFEGAGRGEFERRLQEADLAFSVCDGTAARQALEDAHRLDEKNYELGSLLGEMSFEEGETERALGYFRAVLAEKPDHFEGLVYGGALYYERSELRRAEELLKRAAGLSPDSFLPHLSLGSVYLAGGDLPRAAAHLERAITLDPAPQALYLFGTCLYEMGRLGEAIKRLEEAVDADPALEEAHQLLGLAYLDRRWSRKALDALGRAQRLNPKRSRSRDLVLFLLEASRQPSPILEGEAAKAFERAAVLLDRGDLKQALATYRRALAHDPDHPMLLMSYALVSLQLDRGQEIEALTRRVLELEPGEMLKATAYATLIEALRSQGRYREGNRVGLRLLDEGASNFTKTLAYYEMAYNLAEMDEDLDAALDYARRSVEFSPDELKQLPLAALGWVHYKRREFAQAVDVLSEASERAPTSTTLNHLGMALLAAGQNERARSVLARARRLAEDGKAENRIIECVRTRSSPGKRPRGGRQG